MLTTTNCSANVARSLVIRLTTAISGIGKSVFIAINSIMHPKTVISKTNRSWKRKEKRKKTPTSVPEPRRQTLPIAITHMQLSRKLRKSHLEGLLLTLWNVASTLISIIKMLLIILPMTSILYIMTGWLTARQLLTSRIDVILSWPMSLYRIPRSQESEDCKLRPKGAATWILLRAITAPHIRYAYVTSYTSRGIEIIYFPSGIGLPRAVIFWAENSLLFPNKVIALWMEP